MKTLGYNQPLYILPFDHRGSFVTKMFGWHGGLTAAQTAEIAAAKQVIYDWFKTAVAEGAPKNKAGILVDEQFEAAILRDAKPMVLPPLVQPRRAVKMSLILNTAMTLRNTSRPLSRLFARCSCVTIPKAMQH